MRVRAVNAFGTSAPSNEAVLVVSGSPGTATGAPTGLTNTVNTGGTVGFAWNAASGSPASYIIEAGSQSGLANLANSDLGNTATTMTATGVGAGTYYVRVRAKNAYGISAPSNEVVVTVGAPGCSPNLDPTQANFVGTFIGAIPVGPSSGSTGTFVLQRLSGSDVAFQGSYTDSAGRRGSAGPGLFSGSPASPRVYLGFCLTDSLWPAMARCSSAIRPFAPATPSSSSRATLTWATSGVDRARSEKRATVGFT